MIKQATWWCLRMLVRGLSEYGGFLTGSGALLRAMTAPDDPPRTPPQPRIPAQPEGLVPPRPLSAVEREIWSQLTD